VSEWPRTPASSIVSLDLTIPTDERFLDTVGDVTRRAAEYVGFHKQDAHRIGEAVSEACESLLRASSTPDYLSNIGVSYSTADETFEVRLRVQMSVLDGRSITRLELEKGLRDPGGRRAPVDAMKRVMDRVEFGEEAGVAYCRLTRALPS
jgi:anti-sigma regulatory factor (Ser/Thr protein kinase)